MKRTGPIPMALTLWLIGSFALTQARGQAVEEFFSGKTLTLIVSAGAGGGYDVYARTLAAYLGRHIPGSPAIVVQNMTGAGGLRAALYLYNVAPKDGTVIALVQSTSVLSPLLGTFEAKFDPLRYSWIGSMSREYSLCVSWHESRIRTVQDLFEKEFVVGSSGAGTAMEAYPNVINNVLGTHIKVISGYNSGADVLIAMERREVDGRCGASLATYKAVRPDWLRDRAINILLQTSLQKDPELPDVPSIIDYAKTEQQNTVLDLVLAPRLIQRPLLGPPGIPNERLAALQDAFDATLADPDFIENATAHKLEISLMRAVEVRSFIERLARFPPETRIQAAAAVGKRN